MSKPICVNDFEKLAKEKVSKKVWDFYRGGATDEQTLKDNCLACKRYVFRPKVLNDVSNPDLSTSVLGSKLEIPICIAATAYNKMAHPLGEVAVAKGAAMLNTGFMLSTWATSSIEEVADATSNSTKWLQVYIFKERHVTKAFVERAINAGYQGFFLTVDTPVLGIRYGEVKNNFFLPPPLRHANFHEINCSVIDFEQSDLVQDNCLDFYASAQWSDVAWLKSLTHLPIVLKGILTAEMANQAVIHGVDGIVVSNHGARQLDGVPAAIDALAEVATAVSGRCEVYLDGGIRCGNDVLKALALGAKAVFIGRPAIWGLAYNGEQGVADVLNILKEELKNAMQLLGCKSINDLQTSSNLVVHESFYKSRL